MKSYYLGTLGPTGNSTVVISPSFIFTLYSQVWFMKSATWKYLLKRKSVCCSAMPNSLWHHGLQPTRNLPFSQVLQRGSIKKQKGLDRNLLYIYHLWILQSDTGGSKQKLQLYPHFYQQILTRKHRHPPWWCIKWVHCGGFLVVPW